MFMSIDYFQNASCLLFGLETEYNSRVETNTPSCRKNHTQHRTYDLMGEGAYMAFALRGLPLLSAPPSSAQTPFPDHTSAVVRLQARTLAGETSPCHHCAAIRLQAVTRPGRRLQAKNPGPSHRAVARLQAVTPAGAPSPGPQSQPQPLRRLPATTPKSSRSSSKLASWSTA